MAFSLSKQILFDSNKRTVIKLIGKGTPDDSNGNLAVGVAGLYGYRPVVAANIGPVSLVGIKAITFDINSPGSGSVELYWYGANANSTIITLARSGTIQFESDQMIIPNDAQGATGDVFVKTTGFNTANASYTLILDIRKDSNYFDPGAFADPIAFNQPMFDPNSVAFFSAVISNGGTISDSRKILYDQFIRAERASGAWERTDDYWILWGENSIQSRVSLKRRILATVVNSPTFIANRGFQFDGATNYINTNTRPIEGTRINNLDSRISSYELTDVNAGSSMGCNFSGPLFYLTPKRDDNVFDSNLNARGLGISTNSLALTSVSRFQNIVSGWKRGIPFTVNTSGVLSGVSPPFSQLFLSARNNNDSTTIQYRAALLGFASIGASLSPMQELANYNAVQAFAAAVGAAV